MAFSWHPWIPGTLKFDLILSLSKCAVVHGWWFLPYFPPFSRQQQQKLFFYLTSTGGGLNGFQSQVLPKPNKIHHTLLPTKRDGHRNVGDQFHLFLALLGVLSWSRLVAPLRPSNNFYLIVRGRLHQFPCGPPCENRLKKVGGSQGYHLSKSTQDT